MENEIFKLKQYLLGNLPPEDAEEIDLQVISDASLEEKLQWAESELAEDFLEGALSPQETELFRKHFLVSAERENQLKHIALLKKYSLNACVTQKSAVSRDDASDNFFQRLKKFFSLNSRPALAVLALLIICLAAGITWRMFFSATGDELTQMEKEYAAKNQRDLSNLSDFSQFKDVSLMPGTLRDTSSGNKLKQDDLTTEDVFFRLALPFEVNDETLFNVNLVKDGKTVFRQNQIRVYRNKSGQEIRLFLVKSVLAKGQYQITLQNLSAKNSLVTYNFTVE